MQWSNCTVHVTHHTLHWKWLHINTMEPIESFSLTWSLSVILRVFCGLELNEQVRFWAPFALLANWLAELAIELAIEVTAIVPSVGESAHRSFEGRSTVRSAELALICESLGDVCESPDRFSCWLLPLIRCGLMKCWWSTWCLGELEVNAVLLFRSASSGVSGCRWSACSPFSRRSLDSFSRLFSPLLAGSMRWSISCFSYSSSWPRKLKFGEMVARFPFKYLVVMKRKTRSVFYSEKVLKVSHSFKSTTNLSLYIATSQTISHHGECVVRKRVARK